MSQVFFDELGLPEPRVPARPAHRRPGGDDAGRSATAIDGEQPDWVLVYGDTNSTLAGARAAGEASRSRTSRPGCAASTSRCRRSATGSRSTGSRRSSSARTSARPRSSRARASPAAREVVGDVMADATRLFAPIARERSRSSTARARAGGYVVADDPPRGERASRSGCARIVDGARPRRRPRRLPRAPAHAPSLDAQASRSAERPSWSSRSATSTCPRSPRRRASIVTDSGGLQKEAYWSASRA